MSFYSMPKYFQNMPTVGIPLNKIDEENEKIIREVEDEIKIASQEVLQAGRSDESLNKSGQMTAIQRIEKLIDAETWCPLNTLYNPENFETGTGIVVYLGNGL